MDYRSWNRGQRAFVYTLGLMSEMIRAGHIDTYDGSTVSGRADYDAMVRDGYAPKPNDVQACALYISKDEKIAAAVKDMLLTKQLDRA